MPISKKHKIIFVHIPKNAGTYVESQLLFSGKNRAFLNDTADHDLLIGKNLQHLSYRDLCLLSLSTDTTGYQAFAVYRHPASRLASILNYTYIPYVKKEAQCYFHFLCQDPITITICMHKTVRYATGTLRY